MKPRNEQTITGEERFNFDLQEMIDLAMTKTIPRANEILLEYIETNYTGQGRLIPINKHENAVGGANILRQLPQYEGIDTRLPDTTGTRVLVAKAVTKKELPWKDSDPYETAGGYIKGVCEVGTELDIYLEYNYSNGFVFRAEGEVSILEDHYNNNFFGNSTGNGTKTYDRGERKRRKTITGWNNDFVSLTGKLKFTQVDIQRITSFVRTAK